MRPIVTDRPTLTRKRTLPYAMPSNRTPTTISLSPGSPLGQKSDSRGLAGGSLSRILHFRKFIELHVPVLAAALLHASHVHGLHDVARRRVDRDRPARARELHVLQELHRLVGIEVVAELLHHLADPPHPPLPPPPHQL